MKTLLYDPLFQKSVDSRPARAKFCDECVHRRSCRKPCGNAFIREIPKEEKEEDLLTLLDREMR